MTSSRMRWFYIGWLMLSCLAQAHAQGKDSSADRSKLIALENAWNQAQIHRDGNALNELIGDTFIYTDWDGTVYHKAQFIADTKDPSVETTLVANDDLEVYFYPGMAIIAGAYHAKGTSKGKPFDNYGRFTDTWVLANSKWQCVASHTNHVKKR